MERVVTLAHLPSVLTSSPVIPGPLQEVRWPVGEEYGFPEELDPLVEVVRRAGIVLRLTPLRPLGASKGEQAHFVALRIGIHSGRQAALAPLRKLS